MSGNKNLIKLLEDAKSAQLLEFAYSSQEFTGTDILRYLYSFSKRWIGSIVE